MSEERPSEQKPSGRAPHEQKPSPWVYLLTGGVLLLGTVVVVAGRPNPDARMQANGVSDRRDATCAPLAVPSEQVTRGAALEQRECAGCHANDTREVGPSYQMIAARYHCRPGELHLALAHPQPGWPEYPPGPVGPSLQSADQAALVSWILSAGGTSHE